MSILGQLKALNITPDLLRDLNKSGIIRIEKTLKAEVKFNDDLTINEAEEVISLLRNNRTELEFLYNSYFNFLRKIIENPNELVTFNTITANRLVFSEDFLEFISIYFEKPLELYVVNCNKEMHYYALFSLLGYKDILSESLLDSILESLKKQVLFGIDILNLSPKGPFNRVDYLSNPFFYRCITKIEPIALEEDIIKVVNTTVKYEDEDIFYIKIYFALGDYKSYRTDLANIITNNKKKATERGVSEKYYEKDEMPKKGGTVVKRSFGCLIFFLICLLVCIGGPLAENYFSKNEVSIKTIVKKAPSLETRTIKDSVLVSNNFRTTYDSLKYFQGNSFKLLKERPINLEIEADIFFENLQLTPDPNPNSIQVILINESETSIIVLLKAEVRIMIRYLPTNAICFVSPKIKGLSLYIGKEPQFITCETKTGKIVKGFRFKNWSLENRAILDRYTFIERIKGNTSKIIITNDNFKIK